MRHAYGAGVTPRPQPSAESAPSRALLCVPILTETQSARAENAIAKTHLLDREEHSGCMQRRLNHRPLLQAARTAIWCTVHSLAFQWHQRQPLAPAAPSPRAHARAPPRRQTLSPVTNFRPLTTTVACQISLHRSRAHRSAIAVHHSHSIVCVSRGQLATYGFQQLICSAGELTESLNVEMLAALCLTLFVSRV